MEKWQEVAEDETGYVYYWNTETQETTWDMPDDFTPASPSDMLGPELEDPPEAKRLKPLPKVFIVKFGSLQANLKLSYSVLCECDLLSDLLETNPKQLDFDMQAFFQLRPAFSPITFEMFPELVEETAFGCRSLLRAKDQTVLPLVFSELIELAIFLACNKLLSRILEFLIESEPFPACRPFSNAQVAKIFTLQVERARTCMQNQMFSLCNAKCERLCKKMQHAIAESTLSEKEAKERIMRELKRRWMHRVMKGLLVSVPTQSACGRVVKKSEMENVEEVISGDVIRFDDEMSDWINEMLKDDKVSITDTSGDTLCAANGTTLTIHGAYMQVPLSHVTFRPDPDAVGELVDQLPPDTLKELLKHKLTEVQLGVVIVPYVPTTPEYSAYSPQMFPDSPPDYDPLAPN